MTDAWPDDLPHGVIDFEPVGGGRSGGAFNGMAPAIDASSGGAHWRATVSQLPLHREPQIRAARALEGILDGGAGSVFVPACDGRLRPTVTASFAADYAGGAFDVELTTAGDTLVGGEHFSVTHADASVGKRMYRLVEDRGGGVWRITPYLRAAVTSGDALDFENPECPMRLESGFDLPIEMQRFGGVEATLVEYFDRSPAPEVTEPESPPTEEARYWRIRSVHTHDGDVLFSPAEFGFLDDWAGSRISATAISSTEQNATHLVDAYDGLPLTFVSLAGSGGWIGQDNGAPTPRAPEFYLIARTEAGYQQMPSALVYEESQDGVTWSPVKVWSDLDPWIGNEMRVFAIADEADAPWDGAAPPQWRKQRIRALTLGSGVEFGLEEIGFYDSIADPTSITGTYRGWILASGAPANLTDGSFATTASVISVPNAYFLVDNGISPRDEVAEVKLQSKFFSPNQAPLTFVLEGTNWAGDWAIIQTFTTGTWPGNVARRFSV